MKDSLFVSHMDWSVDESAGTMGETVARLTLPCLAQRYYSVARLTLPCFAQRYYSVARLTLPCLAHRGFTV